MGTPLGQGLIEFARTNSRNAGTFEITHAVIKVAAITLIASRLICGPVGRYELSFTGPMLAGPSSPGQPLPRLWTLTLASIGRGADCL